MLHFTVFVNIAEWSLTMGMRGENPEVSLDTNPGNLVHMHGPKQQ